MLTPELEAFIERMPKVELHIHLEGSILPQTFLDLAQRNEVDIPATDRAGVEQLFHYQSFGEFLSVFMTLTRTIVRPEDFEQLAYEMGLMLSAQHILYAEVMISPMQHLLNGINLYKSIRAVWNGFERARCETGILLRIALDYGRQYGTSYAWYVLEVAREMRDCGVVAWSIGGNEIHHPPEPFAEVFAAARGSGLHVMAHAGEVEGPDSVWGAVHALQSERLGHGIRSIDDPELVVYLRDHRVVLDISPSSNILTGAAASWEQHPLRRLYDAGVLVTINSDDPTFFCTTLTEEYRRVTQHFGFTVDELCVLVLNSAQAAFLPPEEKAALVDRVSNELDTLRAELGI